MRPIVLNQSGLKDFLNCQRLFAWKRLQNLEPVSRRSAPEIGTAVHAGLAVLHAEGGTPEAALVEAKKKLKERAGPQVRFEDKSLEEADEIMHRVLQAYFVYWTAQDQVWTPIQQEVQFLVEVGTGTGVWLRGRADNLSITAAGLFLVDYKTSGKMDPRDLLKYELDMQLTAYLYGLSKQLTEDSRKEGQPPVQVQGAIVDLLVKTKVPQFARELYTRTEEELAEFEAEFVEYGQRIRSQLDRVQAGERWKIVFPRNTEHCFRFGTCPFRDVCLRDTPVRRAIYNKREPDYVDEAQAGLNVKEAQHDAPNA